MYILKRQIFFPTLIFLSTLAYFFFITLTIWHNIPVNVHTHICVSSISEYGFHDISNTDFLFIAVLSRAWHTLHSKMLAIWKKAALEYLVLAKYEILWNSVLKSRIKTHVCSLFTSCMLVLCYHWYLYSSHVDNTKIKIII